MTKLNIGDRMPDFPDLPAADFKAYCGHSFTDKGVLIVAFTSNHCPYVQALEDRIKTFVMDHRDHNVCLIAINSNDESSSPDDDYEQMVLRARTHEYPFPYLRDADQEVARLFGATHTPEFFVFDGEQRLRYHGRFDDNWQNADGVSKQYVADAVAAIQKGADVEIAETAVEGCTIKGVSEMAEGASNAQ
jgi:peroxiredoxin